MTTQDDKPESGRRSPKTQLRPAASDWSLRAKDSTSADQVFPVRDELRVGREDCDIALTSHTASRQHARLFLADGVLRVQDLESANGTFVNGERVETAELKPGDEVSFDTEVFVVDGPQLPEAETQDDDNRTVLRAAVEEEPAQEARTQLRAAAAEWTLKAKDQAAERTFAVRDELRAGRVGCDILLTGEQASREHARIFVADGGLRIEDLGSSNGTFVNEERVESTELKPGDEVRFDSEVFVVDGPASPGDAAGEAADTPAEDRKTSLRAAAPETPRPEAEAPSTPAPAQPESEPDQAPETPAEEGSPAADAESEDAERRAWFERTSVNQTRHLDSGEMRNRLTEGGTQVVRGVQQVDTPSLIGTSEAWAGTVIKLDRDKMTIGRSGTDIILDDPGVSTKHAQIAREGERWKVADTMSRNGVYVNGNKTQVAFLSPGDALRFGNVELRFVTDTTQVGSRSTPETQDVPPPPSAEAGKFAPWLYFAIGFVAVLAIGAYLLFATGLLGAGG